MMYFKILGSYLRYHFLQLFVIVSLFVIFNAHTFSLLAAETGGVAVDHLTSLAAGISAPSVTSSLFENPSGLFLNSSTKFYVEGGTPLKSPLSVAGGGMAFIGNGSVGVGFGFRSLNFQKSSSENNNHLLQFGAATYIPQLQMAFGISSNAAGIMYNPLGNIRMGLTVYDLFTQVKHVGAGISMITNPYSSMGVDFATGVNGNDKVFKPGFSVYLPSTFLEFVLGYGVVLDDADNTVIRKGLSLGLGYRFNARANLQIYYNQIASYYAGLTFTP